MAMRKVSLGKSLQLKVCATFEASRLNLECVAQAYERIVPIAKGRSADERLTEHPASREAAGTRRKLVCER